MMPMQKEWHIVPMVFWLYCKGSFDKAEKYLMKGIKFCGKSKNFTWCAFGHLFMGELNCETKKYYESFNAFDQSTDWVKKSDLGVSCINIGLIGTVPGEISNG